MCSPVKTLDYFLGRHLRYYHVLGTIYCFVVLLNFRGSGAKKDQNNCKPSLELQPYFVDESTWGLELLNRFFFLQSVGILRGFITTQTFDASVDDAHCCVRDGDDVTPIQWLIGLGLGLGFVVVFSSSTVSRNHSFEYHYVAKYKRNFHSILMDKWSLHLGTVVCRKVPSLRCSMVPSVQQW